MLTPILGIIVALITALLVIASTRPDSFTVERKISIQAPPDKVFAAINDFHEWARWSPWEKLDPAMRRSYTGTPSGVGTHYAWEGNSKVGAGKMEIIQASPPISLIIKLDFLKPFEGHNTTTFTFTSHGSSTEVSWAMHGPSPFMFKLMGIFMNMDQMIGKDFEAGLKNLKGVMEG